MTSTQSLEEILIELEGIDPLFKMHRAEIIKIIEKLLINKPDVKLDEAFVQKLKTQLMNKSADPLKSTPLSLKLFILSFGALTVCLMIFVVSHQLATQYGTLNNGRIVAVKDRAFGDLLATSGAVPTATNGVGGGLGGGGSATLDATKMSASMLPYPGDYTQYTYVYRGELPALTDSQVEVYKDTIPKSDYSSASLLKNATAGLMDVGMLEKPKLTSFTLAEDKDLAYDVSVSNGVLSMNADYQRWPQTYPTNQLTVADALPDDKLVSIATAFLDKYKIPHNTAYGQPIVQNDWRIQPMPVGEDGLTAQLYVPESIAVVFPYLINGESAFDQNGSPQGMTVSVSLRSQKVDYMWGAKVTQYESSKYEAVTDAELVKSVLAKGGTNGYLDPNAKKTVEIEVGAPEKILTTSYVDVPGFGATNIYVPAWRFPVISERPKDGYIQNSIIVPLAKELLVENQPTPILYQTR